MGFVLEFLNNPKSKYQYFSRRMITTLVLLGALSAGDL
jgi:hypothetical protein